MNKQNRTGEGSAPPVPPIVTDMFKAVTGPTFKEIPGPKLK